MFGHNETNELLRQLLYRLTAIEQNQSQILQEITKMALDISSLTAAVTAETTVDASVEALITGMATQIQTLINSSGNTVDPVALQAIVTQMTTNAAGLTTAVTTNTPAAPASAKRPGVR